MKDRMIVERVERFDAGIRSLVTVTATGHGNLVQIVFLANTEKAPRVGDLVDVEVSA